MDRGTSYSVTAYSCLVSLTQVSQYSEQESYKNIMISTKIVKFQTDN